MRVRTAATSRTIRTAVVLLCAAGAGGCPNARDMTAATGDVPGTPGMPAPAAPDAEAPPEDPPRMLFLVRSRLATIQLPLGTVSASEDLWSYLDEEPVTAVRSAALGRNGIRVGIGRAQDWPGIEEQLRRLTGQGVRQVALQTLPNDPQPIVLRTGQPAQTIFLSRDDGTLAGADYPPGDNVLTLSFGLDDRDLSRVLVNGLFQIRSSRRHPEIVKNGGTYQFRQEPRRFPLGPLAFQAPVDAGDFLVIGPNAAARRPTSAGRHFLLRCKEGMHYETLLILFPEARRIRLDARRDGRATPGAGPGASAGPAPSR